MPKDLWYVDPHSQALMPITARETQLVAWVEALIPEWTSESLLGVVRDLMLAGF